MDKSEIDAKALIFVNNILKENDLEMPETEKQSLIATYAAGIKTGYNLAIYENYTYMLKKEKELDINENRC